MTPQTIIVTLPADVLEQLAEQAAELVLERMASQPASSEYLTVDEAAEMLRCGIDKKTGRVKRQRVYDLVSARRLTRFKDGSRVLISRRELEEHLRGEAPTRPQPATGSMNRRVAR